MKKLLFLTLAIMIPVFAIGVSVSLTATPTFLLNGTVTLTMYSSPTISSSASAVISIYNSSTGSTQTLSPSFVDGEYICNYNVSDHANYKAQGILQTASANFFSNVATFTSDIPAASVQSTIVYVPFISNGLQSYVVNVQNIGSKTLSFTNFSSPTGLSINPTTGQIPAGETATFSVKPTGVFLPSKSYTLDAVMSTNDPRSGMSDYLLARFLLGPDGLVVMPVSISGTSFGVGSNVSANFSIYYSNNVSLSYVYVVWLTPQNSQMLNLQPSGNDFSSTLNMTLAGTYTLSKIIVGYVYRNQSLEMSVNPGVSVRAVNITPSMNINLVNGKDQVVVNVSSVSTPTVTVKDVSVKYVVPVKSINQTWVGTYTYSNNPGNVSITATFLNTSSVISKSFSKYMVSGGMNITLSDGGWVTIPPNAFSAPSLIAVYLESFNPQDFYTGYSNFNQVSDAISIVSDVTPVASFSYNLYFSNQTVNGLFGDIKVYSYQNGKWQLSPVPLNVEVGMQMVNFQAPTGTYALGLNAQVQRNQSPSIISFWSVPSNLIGQGNVYFYLTVNNDCYYKLYLYDMRGRIVGFQSGMAVSSNRNLVYTLEPSSISNGLYVAVIGIGNLPNSFTQTRSIPFAISK
ncbi:hypothetical protein [Athalassotoga sp.]|uniref:hypothetical protein n=1 Tax=Athalassotoga sp. TaxID=2022597 RepID=UPI003CFD2E36